MKDPVLAEMHAIGLAQKTTSYLGAPLDDGLMIILVPLARRLVAQEITAEEYWDRAQWVGPIRFLDVEEEGDFFE
jgi:hypothetical protein